MTDADNGATDLHGGSLMTTETHFTESGASPPAVAGGSGTAGPGPSRGDVKSVHCSRQEARAGASCDAHSAPDARTGESAYFTPRQVAELLQVSEKTVSRWALENASIPVLRHGRVVRFHRERLLAWLAHQEPRSARRSARTTQGAAPAP